MRDAAGEFDHFDAALDVALGVGDRLAVLAREQFGERLHVARDEVQEFHQHAGAALRIGRAPAELRGLGVLDRGAHLGLGGERHLRDDLARHGLVGVGEAAGRALDVLAADEMGEFPSHACLLEISAPSDFAQARKARSVETLCALFLAHEFSHINRRYRATVVRISHMLTGTTPAFFSPSPAVDRCWARPASSDSIMRR